MSTAPSKHLLLSWEFPNELYELLESPSRRTVALPPSLFIQSPKGDDKPPQALRDPQNKKTKRTRLGDFSSIFATYGWREPDTQSLSSQSGDDSSSNEDESYNSPASSPPDDDSDHSPSTKKKQVSWTDEQDNTEDLWTDIDDQHKIRRKERRSVRIRHPSGHLVKFEAQEKKWKPILSEEGENPNISKTDTKFRDPTQVPQVPVHLQSRSLPSAKYLLPSSVTPSGPSKPLYDSKPTKVTVHTDSILPILKLSRTEKKLRIMKRLLQKTGNASSLLAKNFQHSINTYGGNFATGGIHVFVDSSNITINFQQVLRKARNMSEHSFIKTAPLSFHSLALIMERSRPVAKRALVGSSGRPDAIPNYMYQAEKCGYEVSNLARVEKLTMYKNTRRKAAGTGSGYGTGSGSEGPTSVFKVSEQGVDEILHLKIMESLVDCEPSTLVLATGDAAEAEYSGGFLLMIERAMKKGWKVELVAWRQGMSYAYRSKEFLDKWLGKFTIVYLDDFAEELLAIYEPESESLDDMTRTAQRKL